MKKGLLLVNLGTPLKANNFHVAKFLYLFLNDPLVINLPAPFRILLLLIIIIPLRTAKTLNAYKQIWTPRGSPLMVYSQDLTEKLAKKLAKQYTVALGMRYGAPSIKNALNELDNCQEITVLPLYPHYAEATTGSAINYISKIAKNKSKFKFIKSFYDDRGFINALADKIKRLLSQHDFVLFSYHGLPENQKSSSYRAQCFLTSEKIAKTLDLVNFATSFQSRTGSLPWTKPYTVDTLHNLRMQSYENLLVVCPGFVIDCLETLEEIDMRARHLWHKLGGKTFTLINGLNSDAAWVDAIANLITTV